MFKVDSHQHFWIFDPLRDSWITEQMADLRHDFMPEDLLPLLQKNNISACVAVQADQSEAETDFLIDLAKHNSFIKGVVGWIDLLSPKLISRLEHYRALPELKGFRHIVQAEQPGFMLQPGFLKAISALSKFGFSYDIVIRSSQIKEASLLVHLNPHVKFVLDHLGKPNIKTGDIRLWSADIEELAKHENVYCKLSGMVTEADLNYWTEADLLPYMETVLNAFGPKRLMFGSDWPVCNLAAQYEEVCQIVSTFLRTLSEFEQELIWSGNAVEFYKLGNKIYA